MEIQNDKNYFKENYSNHYSWISYKRSHVRLNLKEELLIRQFTNKVIISRFLRILYYPANVDISTVNCTTMLYSTTTTKCMDLYKSQFRFNRDTRHLYRITDWSVQYECYTNHNKHQSSQVPAIYQLNEEFNTELDFNITE